MINLLFLWEKEVSFEAELIGTNVGYDLKVNFVRNGNYSIIVLECRFSNVVLLTQNLISERLIMLCCKIFTKTA